MQMTSPQTGRQRMRKQIMPHPANNFALYIKVHVFYNCTLEETQVYLPQIHQSHRPMHHHHYPHHPERIQYTRGSILKEYLMMLLATKNTYTVCSKKTTYNLLGF